MFISIAFLPSLGAVFVKTGGWYALLNKPPWNPPSYVFGPVWTLLYAMIGTAGYFVWVRGGQQYRRAAFTVYTPPCCRLFGPPPQKQFPTSGRTPSGTIPSQSG